jgi:hypothetical protein
MVRLEEKWFRRNNFHVLGQLALKARTPFFLNCSEVENKLTKYRKMWGHVV